MASSRQQQEKGRHRREAEVHAFPAFAKSVQRMITVPRIAIALSIAVAGAAVAWLISVRRASRNAWASSQRPEPVHRSSPGDIDVAPAL